MPPFEIAEHADAPDDWDAFVHARGSFYHERAWTAAIAEQFDFEPLYLTARHNGSLAGVLPSVLMRGPLGGRRHVSLPFSYAAGPLAASGEASLGLIEHLRERARTAFGASRSSSGASLPHGCQASRGATITRRTLSRPRVASTPSGSAFIQVMCSAGSSVRERRSPSITALARNGR